MSAVSGNNAIGAYRTGLYEIGKSLESSTFHRGCSPHIHSAL
jgi:hypothetical protein